MLSTAQAEIVLPEELATLSERLTLPELHDIFAGFGVRGYRSFGGEVIERIGPIRKLHLLAGQNNAGKSNSLRAFSELLPVLTERNKVETLYRGPRVWPDGWSEVGVFYFSVGLDFEGALADLERRAKCSLPYLREFLGQSPFTYDMPGLLWFDFRAESGQYPWIPPSTQYDEAIRLVPNRGRVEYEVQVAMSGLGATPSGLAFQDFDSLIGQWQLSRYLPEVESFEASRKLTSEIDAEVNDKVEIQVRNGAGLIAGLARLQSPNDEDRARDAPRFSAIVNFLREVLEDDTATLQVNYNATELSVQIDGSFKPLRALGSGIEQVVLLAAAATLAENKLMVVEEPELFLHPSLQRRLIEYLYRSTSNRYVMSTHSAHILNAELAAISHVSLESKFTRVKNASMPSELAVLVGELGYRASDIVQSNFLVWVEGPSDRIYVRAWLAEARNDLEEGVHYSVMFYGGALLNHLTASDPQVTEFVNLTRLNRHFAVVIDSDLGAGKTADDLNATKKRVIRELSEAGLFAWVTKGYTIENYVHPDLMITALKELYPRSEFKRPTSTSISPVRSIQIDGQTGSVSKPMLAMKVVELAKGNSTAWQLDALERASELAARIVEANGLNRDRAQM